jgi:hypothetical protein
VSRTLWMQRPEGWRDGGREEGRDGEKVRLGRLAYARSFANNDTHTGREGGREGGRERGREESYLPEGV